jgi:hypothetical protein
MSRTDAQLKFRIPPNLKPKLERAAATNKRSLNMEIIARLERSFEAPDPVGDARSKAAADRILNLDLGRENPALEHRLAEMERRIAALEGGAGAKKRA